MQQWMGHAEDESDMVAALHVMQLMADQTVVLQSLRLLRLTAPVDFLTSLLDLVDVDGSSPPY